MILLMQTPALPRNGVVDAISGPISVRPLDEPERHQPAMEASKNSVQAIRISHVQSDKPGFPAGERTRPSTQYTANGLASPGH
jgi:hypothetical protein